LAAASATKANIAHHACTKPAVSSSVLSRADEHMQMQCTRTHRLRA
jgi:hypothetical protein